MNGNEIALTFNDLELTIENIYREMGYGRNTPDPITIDTTKEILYQISKITTPRFYYEIFNGKQEEDHLIINDTRFNTSKTISTLMQGASKFAVFVATAGIEYQEYLNTISAQNDMIRLFIADAIGSCIAELSGNEMERYLEQEIDTMQHTNRFSPGYCGWHVSEQQKLFSLLNGNSCGITLNDSSLMHPIKSISGIMGIGEKVNTKVYGCHICEMKHCRSRGKH